EHRLLAAPGKPVLDDLGGAAAHFFFQGPDKTRVLAQFTQASQGFCQGLFAPRRKPEAGYSVSMPLPASFISPSGVSRTTSAVSLRVLAPVRACSIRRKSFAASSAPCPPAGRAAANAKSSETIGRSRMLHLPKRRRMARGLGHRAAREIR